MKAATNELFVFHRLVPPAPKWLFYQKSPITHNKQEAYPGSDATYDPNLSWFAHVWRLAQHYPGETEISYAAPKAF